jgi:hypothetical protein
MKQINPQRVAANLGTGQLPEPSPPKQVQVDPRTKSVIDGLFVRLKGLCPGWRQSWPTDADEGAAKREWLAAFMLNGINDDRQLRGGMRALQAKRRQFVPAVGEFVEWCFSPEALGLPDFESAYKQAVRNTHPASAGRAKWSHPAIYHAAIASGFYSLQRLERDLGLKRFTEKYMDQCRKIGQGIALEPVPIAELPAPFKPATPEVASNELAAIRKLIGGVRA